MNTPGASPGLRAASPADAADAAPLLRLSMEPFADFYFSGHPRLSTDEVLAALFRLSSHRFSHDRSIICIAAGQPAGLLTAFPGAHVFRLSMGLALRLLQVFGLGPFRALARRMIDYAGVREAGSDEFYIGQLAVLPAFQRRGLGALLLRAAEQQALAAGLLKCSLMVDSANSAAVRLYESFGYIIAGSEPSRYPGFKIEVRTYLRMLKHLPIGAGSEANASASPPELL